MGSSAEEWDATHLKIRKSQEHHPTLIAHEVCSNSISYRTQMRWVRREGRKEWDHQQWESQDVKIFLNEEDRGYVCTHDHSDKRPSYALLWTPGSSSALILLWDDDANPHRCNGCALSFVPFYSPPNALKVELTHSLTLTTRQFFPCQKKGRSQLRRAENQQIKHCNPPHIVKTAIMWETNL